MIAGNRFYGNEVGQKGSAIYSRQISFLEIVDNEFDGNVPSYAFRRDIYRPYEMAFLKQEGFLSSESYIVSTLFPSIEKSTSQPDNLIYHNELTYL